MVYSDRPMVTRWLDEFGPDESGLIRGLLEKDIQGITWSNGPGNRYPAHSHPYQKTIYVLEGSIRFILAEQGKEFELIMGDRFDLPAQLSHSALVGSEGVRCLEIHK